MKINFVFTINLVKFWVELLISVVSQFQDMIWILLWNRESCHPHTELFVHSAFTIAVSSNPKNEPLISKFKLSYNHGPCKYPLNLSNFLKPTPIIWYCRYCTHLLAVDSLVTTSLPNVFFMSRDCCLICIAEAWTDASMGNQRVSMNIVNIFHCRDSVEYAEHPVRQLGHAWLAFLWGVAGCCIVDYLHSFTLKRGNVRDKKGLLE